MNNKKPEKPEVPDSIVLVENRVLKEDLEQLELEKSEFQTFKTVFFIGMFILITFFSTTIAFQGSEITTLKKKLSQMQPSPEEVRVLEDRSKGTLVGTFDIYRRTSE